MVEYIEDLTELPDGERYGEIYEDQVEKVVKKVLETAEEIKVNDIIIGHLLKASILNKLSNKPHSKDLTFSQYDSWMCKNEFSKNYVFAGKA